MKILLDKIYKSELIANTDLHAGGLFFCIIYVKKIVFLENGNVRLLKKIVDPFRPMDPQDVAIIEHFETFGKYFINDRGYIICEFEDINLTYTGLPTEKSKEMLSFHVHNNKRLASWGEVFTLDKVIQ